MKKNLFFILIVAMLVITACGSAAADPVGAVGDGGEEGLELGGSAQQGKPSGGGTSGFSCSSVATGKSLDTLRSELLTALNAHRSSRGVAAVAMQDQLNSAAQRHSDDMAANTFMSHTGTDGSWIDTRIDQSGYVKNWWAENIVGGYTMTTGQAAVNWWIGPESTQTHKDNMVGPNFTQVGIGYAYNANDTALQYCHYWTLVFASPR